MQDEAFKPHEADIFAGRKVREFRLIKGLSQQALAAQLGVSFQQVQKYETGRNRLSISRANEIATVLEISPTEFFEATNTQTTEPLDRRTAQWVKLFHSVPDTVLREKMMAMVAGTVDAMVSTNAETT